MGHHHFENSYLCKGTLLQTARSWSQLTSGQPEHIHKNMRWARDVNLQSGTGLLLLELRCLWEELDRRVEEGA